MNDDQIEELSELLAKFVAISLKSHGLKCSREAEAQWGLCMEKIVRAYASKLCPSK